MQTSNNTFKDQKPKDTNDTTTKSNSKSGLKKYLTVILIVVLLVISLAFIYLYWQEKNNQSDVSNNTVNQQKSTPEKSDDDKIIATYTAKVGKFQLDLPNNYAIILKIDGPFEGGPVTQLQIGQVGTGSNNVISLPALGEITVTAIPASNYGNNFEAFLAGAFDEQLSTAIDSSVTFDGVIAEVYRIDGLATTEVYVFENSGIYYQVSFDSPDQENYNQTKNDIIKGFTFVE